VLVLALGVVVRQRQLSARARAFGLEIGVYSGVFAALSSPKALYMASLSSTSSEV